jgi:hypothetical protein
MLPYRAFLLTCWQEETTAANPIIWRFRLEEARTGEQHGFIDLQEVMAFVKAELKKSGHDQKNRLE